MIDEKKAETITVDRGQPVIVTVLFGDGDPDEVYFDYTKPGEERPYVDDGYGQSKSKIERLGEGTYRYVISTDGFSGGDGVWHFFGEWGEETIERPYDKVSIFGEYHVNQAPVQLL